MRDWIIVGSAALQYWSVTGAHAPRDLDIFYREGSEKPVIERYSMRVEYHELPKEVFDKFVFADDQTHYPTLESLYVLKLSHSEYDVHWHKTVSHIQLIKKYLWARGHKRDIFNNLSQEYKDLFYALKDFWKTVHKGKKEKISFKSRKAEFFNQHVKRVYDHDFIHQTVKYYDQPLYKKCLKDGEEVFIDKAKFDMLTFEDKIKLVREEVYVLALERMLIPSDFKICKHEAYRHMLKRFVTNMSKNWLPTFVVDNYDILYKIDVDYEKLFKERIVDDQQAS